MKFFILLLSLFLIGCGCDKYASDYSCSYVIDDANYDVFYYKDVMSGSSYDGKWIGNTKGLRSCKNIAENYASQINEEWNDRSYICMLIEDGKNQEKHRLLE